MKSHILLPLLCLMLFGCKKVPIAPGTGSSSEEPMFFANFAIDGTDHSFTIGENTQLYSNCVPVGGNSLLSSIILDESGNSFLLFEFAIPGELTVNSFNTPISFTSPNVNYSIDIADVSNGQLITNGSWRMMGVDQGTTLSISEWGVYDVEMDILEMSGQPVQLNLRDKLIVGGIEVDEPDFTVSAIGTDYFATLDAPTPSGVDNVLWYVGSEEFGDKQPFDPINGISITNPYAVITCEFYSEGELINYKSQMVSNPFSQPSSLVEISQSLTSITAGTSISSVYGKISCFHNGQYYSTIYTPLTPTFDVSNVHSEIESITGHEYIVTSINFESDLMNASNESIHVTISGDFGFITIPN